MSLLRIYGAHPDQAQRYQWVLLNAQHEPVAGEGTLTELPRHVQRVQLVIPAAQVTITRVRLPQGARRRGGPVLAFAVEDRMIGEPDAHQVSWLGAVGDEDVLAVTDKNEWERWHKMLAGAGLPIGEVHCEMLLLPLQPGIWSVAWNGSDGFIRNGEFEGAALDCGDREAPPLLLHLLLDEAKSKGTCPVSLAIYTTLTDAVIDTAAWQRELGLTVRSAGAWNWRNAPPFAGVCMARQRQRWQFPAGLAKRLRPAIWLLALSLTIHATALVIDWTTLAGEQRALIRQMEAQFRAAFPETVAVVDPALQMRRKLVEARHRAGLPDSGDFLPMVVQIAAATEELPAGTLRAMSYEGGRMTLELATNDDAAVQRVITHLIGSGLVATVAAPASARTARAPVILIARAP